MGFEESLIWKLGVMKSSTGELAPYGRWVSACFVMGINSEVTDVTVSQWVETSATAALVANHVADGGAAVNAG